MFYTASIYTLCPVYITVSVLYIYSHGVKYIIHAVCLTVPCDHSSQSFDVFVHIHILLYMFTHSIIYSHCMCVTACECVCVRVFYTYCICLDGIGV